MCGLPATLVSILGASCDRHWPKMDEFAAACKALESRKVPEPVRKAYRMPFGAILTVSRDPLRIELLFRSSEKAFQRSRHKAKS